MAHHALARRSRARRAALAVVASAALTAGLGPLLPSASAAPDTPQETVVPAMYRSTYTSASLFNADVANGPTGAGAQGVFHYLEGHPGRLVWTRYSDGRSFDAPTAPVDVIARGTSSDVLSYRHNDGRVELWNAVDGTTSTVQVPKGQSVLGVYGSTVAAYEEATGVDGTVVRIYHLLTAGPDGTTRDVTVHGGPAGTTLTRPLAGDATGLVVAVKAADGALRMAAVDPETGQVVSWRPALPYGYTLTKLSPEHLVVYRGSDSTTALVFSRADLGAAPVEVPLDTDRTPGGRSVGISVVGDWIVHRPGTSGRVTAVPIAGGDPVALLTASNSGVSAAPDGTAVVVGRTGADDWGIQRIRAGADGRPVVDMVKPLPKPPVPIQGLSLDHGQLVVADESYNGVRDSYGRTVAPTGTPEFGERSSFDGRDVLVGDCPSTDLGCSQLFGTADGRVAWISKGSGTDDILRVDGPAQYSLWERGVPAGARITDVSGQYLIYTTATQQTVVKIGNSGAAAVTRTPVAAALSGDVLWSATATPGVFTAYNLTTRKVTETLTTDAGCVPTELQALGRWLYWACDGKAGVYDRTAGRSVSVPVDEAKLGDGYVVTHDKQAGKLVLTAFADGTPASRVIGDLPDTGLSQRDVRWTVDESGGNVAYVDDQERVHLVPSGVPQQPLRLLAPAERASYVEAHEIDTVPDTLATVLLSKPASGWKLTVRNRATGKVYDGTRGGQSARGELTVGWFGDDPVQSRADFVPNGTYDWTLTVTPADGTGAPLEVRGTVRLLHAHPVRHDHVGSDGLPDGTADLLTLNSSGTLTFQQGTGKGTFSGKVSGGGWSTKALAVPFGDLDGDRCNDVLVRMSDGSLRGYKVKCGLAPQPTMAYKKLGTGWNAYNVLTSPGDLTGDGRADLLARKASTGDVYLFAAKSDGSLAAAKKIRSAWTGYTKIVGAGDLNGDGIGDVLARDKAGTLYRYNGLGNGLLKDRVKVFSQWGASYNVIVGVGDVTGDGKSDLVERDTAGNLYRNDGDGKGSFGARTRIATGWQIYKGLF
ncbi:VCBS repeat-containing protein [Streptomyces sp. NPDC047085]|uniref:FG-GAP repeat domain-containing protein n=1 Tax=Streptomyces sp. NPDC047085 TaxID=3155140 RepID=UPI0034000837